MDNHEKFQNHKSPLANYEDHEKLTISYETNENHGNIIISFENHEIPEHHIIYTIVKKII